MGVRYPLQTTDLDLFEVRYGPLYVPSIASKAFYSKWDIEACTLANLQYKGTLRLGLEIQST